MWSEILIKRNIHIIPHLFDMRCPIRSWRTEGRTGTTTGSFVCSCVCVCSGTQQQDRLEIWQTESNEPQMRMKLRKRAERKCFQSWKIKWKIYFCLLTCCEIFSSTLCHMIWAPRIHIFPPSECVCQISQITADAAVERCKEQVHFSRSGTWCGFYFAQFFEWGP